MTGPSRREFLAKSVLGFVGLACGPKSLAREESNVDGELLYVGTYTDDGRSAGIYLIRMDGRTPTMADLPASISSAWTRPRGN